MLPEKWRMIEQDTVRFVNVPKTGNMPNESRAGREGDNSYSYPASYKGVISVAAVDKYNKRANFSNKNDMLDISGPGVGIYSCIPGDRYDSFSGTAMATPHTTGSIALLKTYQLNNSENYENKMKETAKKLGRETNYGSGLVRVDSMVEDQK